LHFRFFFSIFASRKGCCIIHSANAKSLYFQVFWRPPQDIRTPATRYCPARRNNLPRAGQINNMPSRSLQTLGLIPVTTGFLPLSPLVFIMNVSYDLLRQSERCKEKNGIMHRSHTEIWPKTPFATILPYLLPYRDHL
jgi:hypothetical protein